MMFGRKWGMALCLLPLFWVTSTRADQPAPVSPPEPEMECKRLPLEWKPQKPPKNFDIYAVATFPGGTLDYMYSETASSLQINLSTHWCAQVIMQNENGALLCSVGPDGWFQAIKPVGKETIFEACRVKAEPVKPVPKMKAKLRT